MTFWKNICDTVAGKTVKRFKNVSLSETDKSLSISLSYCLELDGIGKAARDRAASAVESSRPRRQPPLVVGFKKKCPKSASLVP